MREWVLGSYPVAVFRRFFELQLLDRSFGLAAQAFVALLPLVIVIVAVVADSDGTIVANQINSRFGLEGAAQDAVRALFTSGSATFALSWTALLLTVYSAFSLSRRLSRTYGQIFELPSLLPSQLWRGVAWVVLEVVLLSLSSGLRTVVREHGWAFSLLAIIGLLLIWFVFDALGVKLLVPSIKYELLVPTAVLGGVSRLFLVFWSSAYMPPTLQQQAEQFGPIGVTFSLFSLILVGVVAMLIAPLLVAVWDQRRNSVAAESTPQSY
ncbi:MAG: hypothetical protein Q8M73_07250 [Actinomycetota bacterium]|nr:hypothetical protein [Actinomycetota bacterium]